MNIYKATKITYDVDDNEIYTTIEFATEEERDNWATENGANDTSEEERVPAPPIIPDVTPRQIRQALILSGISLQTINDTIATLPEPTRSLAQTEWEYSIAFQRNRPLVSSMAALLGLTSTQVDNLWLLAATL